MKRPIFLLVVSFAVLGQMPSSAVAGASFQAMFERVLPGMGANDPPARQAPQQEFQESCRALSAPGRDAERTQACRLIAAKLGPETPNPARVFMLRQLRLIGHGECVAAVARLLADKDSEVKTWACWTLQSNPAPEANTAILTALRGAEGPEWRATLVAALKSRAAPESVDVLVGCLADRDDGVVAATAAALGEISTPKAIEAITAAVSQATPILRRRIGAACIRAAERLVERGQLEQARAIYRQLNVPEQLRPLRIGHT